MNTNTDRNQNDPQSNWSEIKAKIKQTWSRFTDSEIESLRNHLDKLSAQIQKTYGTAKSQADKEFTDFKASLSNSDSRGNVRTREGASNFASNSKGMDQKNKSTNEHGLHTVRPTPTTAQAEDTMESEGGNRSEKKAI